MKQTRRAEKYNAITHGIGIILGIVFWIILLFHAKTVAQIVGYSLYGLGFTFLFSMSTSYHYAQEGKTKRVLRVFDHISIFIFIAGSYSPVLLTVLTGKLRWILFILLWSLALIGTVFKIVTAGKYDKTKLLSVILYLMMGWIAIFIVRPLAQNASMSFILWLIIGGVLYSLGTVFYQRTRHEFSHVIWHVFVLMAALCHFVAIYSLA